MKTLEDEEETAKISIPNEIIEDILLRLPMKSLFRFRSVSKPWLSRISRPSFTKLHLTRATHHTALFFYACDYSTIKRYLFSTAHHGGPVTHLMTLHVSEPYSVRTTQAEHLNGLVFFTWVEKFGAYNHAHALVVNPSTHKSCELTYQNSKYLYEKVYNMQYFLGTMSLETNIRF
ncbi:putative F-box domain-containing protein [Helianthus annuus]|nr:putative F-box domain-containing protein [Helianthus annuus]